MSSTEFSYEKAFSRNLGWMSESELTRLRKSRVAIAGMGGVGGSHLITLVRLGVGAFNIADFDEYGVENFNRQYGASMSTVGQKKAEVMKRLALDINPELDIRVFSEGVRDDNMDVFLAGVDVYLDGLDVFVMDVRQKVFMACDRLGIPAVTVGPLATGAAGVVFLPGKMSFDQYFDFQNRSLELKVLNFILGVAPSFMQARYLMDRSYFDLSKKKAPSTPMGCMMASGVAATEVMKVLLQRGSLRAAPWSFHYDPYLQKMKVKCIVGGHSNLWHRLKNFIAAKIFQKKKD
jgi:molybdopterin/thiamine biosynthesis adenylyltransferase